MLNTIFAVVASIVVAANGSQALFEQKYSLLDRHQDAFVNSVFSDNILLTLFYMDGRVKEGDEVLWDEVRTPREYRLTLNPSETFAFHDFVLPKYEGKVAKTTNAHFNFSQGFKSDGYLMGDGVCHLASFMYVAAKASGLFAESSVNHDFANIPGVPRELGVSIYFQPDNRTGSGMQNLYITNTKEFPIAFVFTKDGDSLNVAVEEVKTLQ